MQAETSKEFEKLKSQIKDIEENIESDKIKVLKVYAGAKNPMDDDYYNIPSELENYNYNGRNYTGLKHHKGNYGVCIGYGHEENGVSLAGIDIDGYKLESDDKEKNAEVKKQTQQFIYNCLKDIPNALICKTQSGGFHIYLWNKTVFNKIHETSENLYFPSDFPIKELRGKSLEASIEIFTKFKSKQMVLPSSKTANGEYKVISENNKLADVPTVDDINKTVIECLVKHGCTYKPKVEEPVKATSTKRSRFKKPNDIKNNNLKELDKKEIKKVVKLVAPLFKTIKDEKHIGALAIGGFFSNNITIESAKRIANGIIHDVGTIFKSNAEFKKTILKNYNERSDIKNKTGLPKFCELVLKKDSEFNANRFKDKLNKICNISFKKENVGDVFINNNQIPIILYETDLKKWLKYEGVFNGIDLILNPTSLIGAFRYTKSDKEIISFNFKFKNYFFDIKKNDLEVINNFLDNSANVKLPTFFIETIRTSINNLDSYAVKPKELSNEVELKQLFKERKRESYARKQLAEYLYKNGVILRKSINQPYKLNYATNGFDSVENDDLIIWLNNNGDFETNSISSDDIKTALTYIGDRRKPTYNIVKFKNCLYDMENFKVIEETEEPVLTLTEVNYNYNPNAKGVKIQHFLETSLKHRDDTPTQIEERVKAFFEFVGYILTSGNPLNCWFIFAGIGGAGKGVATNIITAIFGSKNVGHLQIQELTTDDRFATSNLVNKQINIVTDSPTKPIYETGLLKAITGYDDIPIEFKGQDKSNLPKEEVPDFLTVCNNFPRFAKGFDMQIIQRIIIFEFLNQYRGTKKQNKNLLKEILEEPQELEYLLYQGIEAYKEMTINDNDFKARLDENKTIELLGKHTNPIKNFLLPKLVKVNYYANRDGEEPVIANELNQLLLYVAKQNGLSITDIEEKQYKIKPKTLLREIRECFDFGDEYTTTTTKDTTFKTVKMYPNLCKTDDYDEYLTEMENDDEWQQMLKEMNGN